VEDSRPGLWNRVAGRTRSLLEESFRGAPGTPVPHGFYDELEELLVASDLGIDLAARIVAGVRTRRPDTLELARAALQAELVSAMSPASRRLNLAAPPSVIVLYGINGSGKTTTTGKLAWWLRATGKNPLVVAADTYRAAGIEQTQIWASRAGVECFSGRAGGDPAAAVFDGITMAVARGYGSVVVDTAGRLQTHHNLMQELAKIGRVAGRALEGAPHESLLVLDASIGQASLAQAQGFNRALPISGLVLAKIDGSAKGGAVIAIESTLGVPTKLLGLGEAMEDVMGFEPNAFARSLVGTL
jgi:fused signal recognition particle receptor